MSGFIVNFDQQFRYIHKLPKTGDMWPAPWELSMSLPSKVTVLRIFLSYTTTGTSNWARGHLYISVTYA